MYAPWTVLGVVTVLSCGGPREVSRNQAPRERAVLVATIGGADSSSEFGSVRSVLLDPDGAVYVVDNRSREILRFDSLGGFQRRLGREGAGPAEYRDPYSLAWLGDTLALLDPANARIGLFDRAGQWVGSWWVPIVTGDQIVRLYRTPPDGFWAFGPVTRGDQRESALIHYGPAGPGDTLAFLRSDPSIVTHSRCDMARGMTFFDAPYAPRLLLIPTPERQRAVALTSSYRIAFLTPGGDTGRVIEGAADPVPITDAEWDQATAEFRKFRESNPNAPCSISQFTRPETKPLLQFLFHDADGGLWVEVTTADGSRYDVFDGAGALTRSIEGLPPSRGLDPSVRGDRVAMVVRDSLDIPQVRLYRIDRNR